MRPANGGWVDQVPRLQRFRAEHPDITITPPGKHTALWKARKGGEVVAQHFSLRRLLDALEDPADC